MVLPTFEDINNNLDQQSQSQEQSSEETKAAPAATKEPEQEVNQTTGTTPTTTTEEYPDPTKFAQASLNRTISNPVAVMKKFKEPQFEEESKVLEDPPSGDDDVASESTNVEATGSTPME